MNFCLPYVKVGIELIAILNGVEEQEDGVDCIETFCDSDWAGNSDRRSTTAIIICVNSLVVLSCSRTQKSISLSSCQAETLAMSNGGSEGILIKEIWKFMTRRPVEMELRSDSSSGRQWTQRTGIGRVQYISGRICWLQRAVRESWFKGLAISTKTNVADLNIKRLTKSRRQFLLNFLGCVMMNEAGDVLERIGQKEVLEYLFAERLQKQMSRAFQLARVQMNKRWAQYAFLATADDLQGCHFDEETKQ